jgi:hypothetical protein
VSVGPQRSPVVPSWSPVVPCWSPVGPLWSPVGPLSVPCGPLLVPCGLLLVPCWSPVVPCLSVCVVCEPNNFHRPPTRPFSFPLVCCLYVLIYSLAFLCFVFAMFNNCVTIVFTPGILCWLVQQSNYFIHQLIYTIRKYH